MICDSRAVLNSSATDTAINIPVALNTEDTEGSIILKIIDGINAIRARNIAPKSVILLDIFLRYSVVGLPALIPGMKPPFC